jgi:hypothetical protein
MCWHVFWTLSSVSSQFRMEYNYLLLIFFYKKPSTVEPWFTNLICFWRRFVTRNVRKRKLCVLSESYTATDTLPPILRACRQPLLPACVFITRDTVCHPRLFFFWKICLWTNLFVVRGVHEPRFHCILFLFFCAQRRKVRHSLTRKCFNNF